MLFLNPVGISRRRKRSCRPKLPFQFNDLINGNIYMDDLKQPVLELYNIYNLKCNQQLNENIILCKTST